MATLSPVLPSHQYRRNLPASVGSTTYALSYIRVSSDEQEREGQSIAAQQTETRNYALQRGWIISGEYLDVLSGKRDDRADYQRLLADVRQMRSTGKQVVVIVSALDRFGRRLMERLRSREELKALGVATHSVREGGEVSDLVANVLGSVAEEESRRLGERVAKTWNFIRSSGWHFVGRVPFGYRLRDALEEERAQGAPKRVLDVDPDAAPYVQ